MQVEFTMSNYGSHIIFKGKARGTTKGARYNWIASTRSENPDTIFIHKHRLWFKKKELMSFIKLILSHEPIHQILWREGLDKKDYYDVVRRKFLKTLSKKEHNEVRYII